MGKPSGLARRSGKPDEIIPAAAAVAAAFLRKSRLDMLDICPLPPFLGGD
jgi:hypothetical protein